MKVYEYNIIFLGFIYGLMQFIAQDNINNNIREIGAIV